MTAIYAALGYIFSNQLDRVAVHLVRMGALVALPVAAGFGFYIASPEGLPTMRFFGASPVASALGIRLGATPRGRLDSNTHLRQPMQKGHFYFALTRP